MIAPMIPPIGPPNVNPIIPPMLLSETHILAIVIKLILYKTSFGNKGGNEFTCC